MHSTQPNGTYFKSNYGRWAPLVIYKYTEATALSSKSIRLHLGHLQRTKRRTRGFVKLNGQNAKILKNLNGM
jgi:hypothetical protein